MEKNTENLARITRRSEVVETAEWDLRNAVIRAALDGASWTEIGAALGVSKQTAHNRYAKHVEITARIESEQIPGIDSEEHMSRIYNPEPNVTYNTRRDSSYRRTLHTAAAVEPSKIVDEDRAGASVTPSIFSDAPAPATQPKKRRTEKDVLDSYAAKRARKATMPDLCPGCGKRWHGQEHWDGRPTAFTDCTETQNDHEWTADWPARANHPYPKTQEQ